MRIGNIMNSIDAARTPGPGAYNVLQNYQSFATGKHTMPKFTFPK